jgi:hypothetical protein
VNNTPQAVILGDQAVPAAMSITSDKQCFKILLIEGGSLQELLNEFLNKLGNRRVQPGTAILIFSASYLAEAGLVAYVEELLAMRRQIQEQFGKATKVLPLPPHIPGRLRGPAPHQSCL